VVLGGLGLSKDKEKEAESSAGKTSNPEKTLGRGAGAES